MRTKICPVCASVSFLWISLSALAAWGYIELDDFIIVIALLMGGTVVGVSYLGEKKYLWAARYPQKWKFSVIIIGMFLAYLALINLSKPVVAVEALILSAFAYLFFIRDSRRNVEGSRSDNDRNIREIEKKMKQCC